MSEYSFFAERSVARYRKSDLFFIVTVILLLGFGLFTQYFCTQRYAENAFGDSFYFVKRQMICALAGLAGFFLLASLKMSAIRKAIPVIFFVTLILCLLTFVPAFSVEKNGARRWLKIPFIPMSFTLQSSEIVKFTLVIFLSNLFDKQLSVLNPDERTVFPCVAVLVLFTVLVLLQKDLSTSVFIFAVCFLMFVAAGMNTKWAFAVGILAVPVLILFITSEQYRLDRIVAFLRPDEGIHSINYQSIAAKRAVSSGKFWGTGIGTGLVQALKIPEVQADYIFAGWAEAMGLFGVAGYFVLLGLFSWRGYKIAFECEDRFSAFASFGFVTMILLQSVMNCAVVCGAVPSTGIPLPFFSLGGSSIIVTLCMCGFVVNASRGDKEPKEETYKISGFEEVNINGVNAYE